ncbi:MAG TPA: quinone-dependent dihydroorotate dehydrogenase [Burkholderiales bacterium]|nr:quinone-dependent dihydroorotate dehydrogenase [Burkholderiales bacterium]
MSYRWLRPLLFRLDAERAHALTLDALELAARAGLPRIPVLPGDPVRAMGIDFPNRVGLAAGLDKNAAHVEALARLGFGFIEVGTVTPRPQLGNPRPRLFRIPQARAVINRLGFNNLGVDRLVHNVRSARYRGILGINIGKNYDTPIERAASDYIACMCKVYPLASYLTVNISSPNTLNLRQLQEPDELDRLLGALKSEQVRLADEHGRYIPMAVKIAPDLSPEQIDTIAERLLAHRIDGVIATNTTLSRDGVEGLPHGDEVGGLSGAPLTAKATGVAERLASRLRGRIPIVGVGGIMSATDAQARVACGASLIQLYTGLVYAGPDLICECVRALAQAPSQPVPAVA